MMAFSIRRSSEEVLRVEAVALNRLEFALGSEEARGSMGFTGSEEGAAGRLLLFGI
jgi:hypothetical protein